MMLRAIVLLTALALPALAHADIVSKVDKARDLINQGNAQEAAGKLTEALGSYRAAAQADPTASEPLSYIAMLMFHASKNTDPKYEEQYREQAAAYADAALKVDARDPNAMEALRLLADGVEQQRRQAAPAAQKVLLEGELLFGQKNYTAAALKYEEAIRLDPAYADAVVFLGDCYYMQGDMVRAEQKFRQAAILDPLYGAAWRYLFDALMKQDKLKEAESAAFGALASMPSSVPNWQRVGHALDLAGRPLAQFRWTPRASVKGTQIQIDAAAPKEDGTVWTAYGLALAAADADKANQSPFARNLAAWQTTLKIIDELGYADKIKDAGMRDMVRFNRGGQLRAAIFALHYKEAYRAEFEAWKKQEPDGLKRFVEQFHVGL